MMNAFQRAPSHTRSEDHGLKYSIPTGFALSIELYDLSRSCVLRPWILDGWCHFRFLRLLDGILLPEFQRSRLYLFVVLIHDKGPWVDI